MLYFLKDVVLFETYCQIKYCKIEPYKKEIYYIIRKHIELWNKDKSLLVKQKRRRISNTLSHFKSYE